MPPQLEQPSTLNKVVRFFARNFIRGLLFVAPVAATIWIVVYVFDAIDSLIQVPDDGTLEIPLLGIEVSTQALAFRGAGFVVTVASIIIIGVLTSSVLTNWLLRRVDQLFTHVPVVKLIYSGIKDMVEAFVSEEKKFDKPVLLSLSSTPEVEVIGFITREDLEEFGRPGKVAVYVPQSYNFAANLILVPHERVTPIDLPSGEVMAFVVSGGVSSATKLEAAQRKADSRAQLERR
jgi:uncharacterized membrane protein